MVIPSHSKNVEVVKKTQYIKGKNPNFLAFLRSGWFFPYMIININYVIKIVCLTPLYGVTKLVLAPWDLLGAF